MLDPQERYEYLRNWGFQEGMARLPRVDQVTEMDAKELAVKLLAAILVLGDVPNV